jgi:hypothetical protein
MGMFLTDADCIRQREYVNIPAWHEKGYLGQGLSVFCDDVGGNHVSIVADIIQTILPKARIYTGSIGYTQKSSEITDCTISCTETGERLPFDEFIKKYEINLINNSKDGGRGTEVLPIAKYMKDKIKEHNLIFCGAAGNDAGQPTTQSFNGACIVVTSCNLKKGVPAWSYCCTGGNVDFAMFSGFAPGTSFASPFLLGMAGLLRCKYPGITQDEVYEYFKTHCEDILAPGKDVESGWGLPIMGDPKTIIKMQINNKTMDVDGRKVVLDQGPIIQNRRTLVPIRAISEALGAEVGWDDKTKTVTIER